MLKTFTLWQSNREEAEKWNSVLTPTASLELSKIKSAVSSHPLVVTKMSSTVAVVCRNSEDRHYACVRSVNLADGTCDCGMWMQRQIPCKHAIATIQALGQQLWDESVAVTVDTGDQSATVSAAQSPGMFTYLSNYVSESIAAFQGFESWKPY
jgi:hypothetical protein